MFDVNYLKLGFTIFLSIFLAGTALVFLNGYVQSEMIEQPQPMIKFIERPVVKQAPVSTNANYQPIVVNTLEQLDELNKKKASIRSTNRETCEYWKAQYKKNNNSVNRDRMQSSCARARSY